jgi:hypothetical protein
MTTEVLVGATCARDSVGNAARTASSIEILYFMKYLLGKNIKTLRARRIMNRLSIQVIVFPD